MNATVNTVGKRLLSVASLVGFTGLILVGCGGDKPAETATPAPTSEPTTSQAAPSTDGKDPNKETIVIGTTEGDFADMVRNQVKAELEAQGYKVELKTFTDYVMPNQALAAGDLDINVFQHKPYLDNFKAEHKLDLVEVFQVPTAPLGIYSGKKTKLDEVYDGMKVSAPNDPSNFARALVMMNDLGWIKLKDGIDPLKASKADIAENPKNIEIVELEAANLPRTREEVDFAVINGNYATDAGIKITEALYQEKSYAYVNWSAVKTADKDAKWVQDVTNAYNSDSFKQYAHATFPGYKYPAIWGEQPTDKPADAPADKPADTTADKPANKPAEEPKATESK